MQEVALFNSGPLLKLLLLAAVVALGPLSWVWLRHRHHDVPQRVHQLTALTLFLCFDLVLFGSFTRLSDSGLGCPDWPGCYGHASPLGAGDAIETAQAAMPSGPVTLSKAWVEMLHRYLAMTVGVLILTLAVFSWSRDRSVWGWPTLSLVWVCVQGAFGAFTVTMKLFPAIVSLHLMGGMLLLVLLLMQLLRQRHAPWAEYRMPLPTAVRGWLMAAWGLLLLQIVLGAWVSSNYAVMACDTYPMCQGSWWPEMNFDKGFDLWRSLGLDSAGQALPFQALTAIHFTHRWHALPVAVLLLWSSFLLYGHGLHTQARGLWLLVLLQFITGISNAVLGWPLLAALLHTASAAGLLLLLSWSLAITESRPSGHIAATFSRPLL
ncbi:MAG: heme A synthase [Betaproteobacteria bacterium]|jgi:cytochrome c oxidase assembly protein subunit 15|nr:heme A synthase [Betaproteobacteria bacterium]